LVSVYSNILSNNRNAYKILTQNKVADIKTLIKEIDANKCNLETTNNLNKIVTALFIHIKKVKQDASKPNKSLGFILKIPYLDKSIDKIKINKIFNCNEFKALTNNKNLEKTTIIYNLNPPSFVYTCNYNKVLSSLNSLGLNETVACDCFNVTSDKLNSHVLTGNIKQLTSNYRIVDFLEKGSKYRTSIPLSSEQFSSTFNIILKEHCEKILNKMNLNTTQEISNYLNNSLANLINKREQFLNKYPDIININEQKNMNNILNHLKNKYVITTIDKANGNYAYICKILYINLIKQELGIVSSDTITGNDTYKLYQVETENQILARHSSDISNIFKINLRRVNNGNCSIPLIHAIPKMHKSPIKMRFITGAKNSSIKCLAILLKDILSFFHNHFQNYCLVSQQRNNTFSLWSIKNSASLVKSISNKNVGNKYSLYSGDFASLFTNLPHSIVIKELMYILKYCFKNIEKSGKTHIVKIGNFYKYTHVTDTNNKLFDFNDIVYLANYVLSNSFIRFGNLIFKQINGIPQGSNASSILADITLIGMEHRYVNAHKDMFIDRNFLAARYVDDLFLLYKNTTNVLEHIKNIYHESLILEDTHETSKKCNFLDLCINLCNNFPITNLYNKTDGYSFTVSRYPNVKSCIPDSIIYNVAIGEIIRFARCCTHKYDFIDKCGDLYKQLLINGFTHIRSSNIIKKGIFKSSIHLAKYKTNISVLHDHITKLYKTFG
jgi:hypothetical protein